jgi:hypothetical protein
MKEGLMLKQGDEMQFNLIDFIQMMSGGMIKML